MQVIKTINKKENNPKNEKSEVYPDLFLSPIQISPKLFKNDNPPDNFIGKKLTGDAELISWLSGIEINNKNSKEDEGLEENNSKIKKKLKNKLIKNARKCEFYFKPKSENEEFVCAQCAYCLKKYFNYNELIRFVNFDDFIHYLKYIFYLSDKVTCYSIINYKSNKKSFDLLFSKFKKKEEKWDFNQEKILCKLCMLKLINKPEFMKKMKSILLHGENEKSYNINEGDIIIELNSNENKNKNNKSNFIVEKYKNNNTNKNHKTYDKNKKQINNNINYIPRPLFPQYNYNNPNYLNIYNSNNINININHDNKIINNYYPNNSLLELCEKSKNNQLEIKDINQNQINSYWHQLFFINHNKVVDICKEIKIEIAHLYNYMKIAIQKFLDKEKFNLEYQILQVSRTRTLYLFTQIINYIDINKNYFNVFLNDLNSYPNKENDAKILLELIKENRKNFIKINQIIQKYNESLNFYVNILFRNQ